jgi:hypothetical protein
MSLALVCRDPNCMNGVLREESSRLLGRCGRQSKGRRVLRLGCISSRWWRCPSPIWRVVGSCLSIWFAYLLGVVGARWLGTHRIFFGLL